jgi:hypothetical protein
LLDRALISNVADKWDSTKSELYVTVISGLYEVIT